MLAVIHHKGEIYKANFSQPIDISIPLRAGKENVNAWHAESMKIFPVKSGNWIGDVKQGGPVNFRDIFFNPHGNGTHTECVGHISKEDYSINQCLKNFLFTCEVISILPEKQNNGDLIITKNQVEKALSGKKPEAIAIRTLPNNKAKLNMQYSGTNPAFLHPEAAAYIQSEGIKHLLIDLPSVDREKDEGKLLAHRAFWQYPHHTATDRTITELIYVPDIVPDGFYLLNLQIASFENDASPSKPVLYRIYEQD